MLCCAALVGGKVVLNEHRKRNRQSAPETEPAGHVGALDDDDTGEWLVGLGQDPDDPVDEWDAALREFQAAMEVALSGFDKTFFDAIGPVWAAAVRADQFSTGEFKRIIRGIFEDTDAHPLVGVG